MGFPSKIKRKNLESDVTDRMMQCNAASSTMKEDHSFLGSGIPELENRVKKPSYAL